MTKRRAFPHQFRLVWRYQGQKNERRLVSDSPSAILRMLRRVGTDEPWMGVSPTQLKRSWAWLARRLDVAFSAVADVTPRDVLLGLRDSYPKLEYIRVETRQVAQWTELMDPLVNLRTQSTAKTDAKRRAVLEAVEDMDRAALDAWRWVPDATKDAFRRRGDRHGAGVNTVGGQSDGEQGATASTTQAGTDGRAGGS